MSFDKKDLVSLRVGTPKDKNFVMATWLRGLYYGETWFREIPKDIFMTNYHKVLEKLLASPSVTTIVACLKDDPEVILGYAILGKNIDGSTLHWVFCKSAWRNIGIAKMLIPNNTNTVTHLTKTGLSILRKRPQIQFNPFAMA